MILNSNISKTGSLAFEKVLGTPCLQKDIVRESQLLLFPHFKSRLTSYQVTRLLFWLLYNTQWEEEFTFDHKKLFFFLPQILTKCLLSVVISYKLPQMWWFKIIEIYCLPVLEGRSQNPSVTGVVLSSTAPW